jgi:ATP-dependent RNA helicase DDX56/DBP9
LKKNKKTQEGDLPGADQLAQYHVFCRGDEERFTILLALLKLRLLVGKSVVFVQSTNRCYQ